MRKYIVYNSKDLWSRSEPKSATNPSLRKTRQGFISLAKRCFLVFMEYILRAVGGRSGDVLVADCEDLENRHEEVAQERKLLLPFADGSLKLFDLPRHQRGGMPVKGSLEQDERKNTNYKPENSEDFLEHES